MSPPQTTMDTSTQPRESSDSSVSPCQDHDPVDSIPCIHETKDQEFEDVDVGHRLEEESSRCTLLTLPPELLLSIISYLDARFVLNRLSLVCKELHQLISNNATWKIRISKRWPEQYPVIPVDDDSFNWQLACMEREDQYRLWSCPTAMENFQLTMGHFGEIDSVHLVQNGDLCVSSSRDRSFHLWDLRKLDSRNVEESVKASRVKYVEGHKGWVWHVTSRDNILSTSSWDQWIKLWDMDADCTQTQSFKGQSAFLCSVLHQWEIHAGAYDKRIYLFDRRDGNQSSTQKLRIHKMPVLCLASDDNYIISGSEDMTIAVFDRRAGKLFKRIELSKFPMCMSYSHNQLWVGRKDGHINVIDPTHGRFDVLQTYDVGHKGKITGIHHSLGSVTTCSTDGSIRIHEPNHNPSLIRSLDPASSISAIHASNSVLAAGGSDIIVNIWRPSRDIDDSETRGLSE